MRQTRGSRSHTGGPSHDIGTLLPCKIGLPCEPLTGIFSACHRALSSVRTASNRRLCNYGCCTVAFAQRQFVMQGEIRSFFYMRRLVLVAAGEGWQTRKTKSSVYHGKCTIAREFESLRPETHRRVGCFSNDDPSSGLPPSHCSHQHVVRSRESELLEGLKSSSRHRPQEREGGGEVHCES